jgi:hypothetical protein
MSFIPFPYHSLLQKTQQLFCAPNDRRTDVMRPTIHLVSQTPCRDIGLRTYLTPFSDWVTPTLTVSHALLLRCLRRKNPTTSEPVAARLPVEVWLLILESVGVLSTKDINAVVRTNRFFFDIASHLLYQHIVWTNASHVAVSLPIWNAAGESLTTRPRSIVFGLSRLTEVPMQPVVSVFGPDGSVTPVLALRDARHVEETLVLTGGDTATLASSPLFTEIMFIVPSFVYLETLVFRGAIVNPHWYLVVSALKNLKTLRFERCIIPEAADAPEQIDLPVHELRLLNITRRSRYFTGEDGPTAIYPERLDSLLSSPSLVTLRIDPESLMNFPFREDQMPQGLRHLHLHSDRRGVVTSPLRAVESLIGRILTSCPLVESFSNMSLFNPSLPETLPADYMKQFGLTRYRGSWGFLLNYPGKNSQSLRSLHLLRIDDIPSTFGVVDRNFRGLEVLAVDIAHWDNAVMFMRGDRLQRVVCLHIRYGGDTLDEVGVLFALIASSDRMHMCLQRYIMGLGVFLSTLGSLRTFRLENTSSKDCNFDAHRLVDVLGFHCRGLREIQLSRGFVWKRSPGGGDSWMSCELSEELDSWSACT